MERYITPRLQLFMRINAVVLSDSYIFSVYAALMIKFNYSKLHVASGSVTV